MLIPKDYTAQENLIANCLSEFGLRYDQQYSFHPYTVDFYIPEVHMIIEADGKYGHLRKRDMKRDIELSQNMQIDYILHIKAKTRKEIKEILWQELNKLQDVPQKTVRQKLPENLE